MVLPRWESLETFASQGVEASKLQLLSISGSDQPPSLSCTVCARLIGGGEAILALVCFHVFCPICFEAFLRRRWAELAANQVDSAETEQIPCPKCSINLQRQDVHTLTSVEVAALVAQVRRRGSDCAQVTAATVG